jgi:hypothetical protein
LQQQLELSDASLQSFCAGGFFRKLLRDAIGSLVDGSGQIKLTAQAHALGVEPAAEGKGVL